MMKVILAEEKDLDSIMNIYHSLIGRPGCTWDEGYPNKEIVLKDISRKSMYMMMDGEERIIGVSSAGIDDELINLTCWSDSIKKPCFLARIGIIPEMQNHGYAAWMIQIISEDLITRGFDGVHFLVSKTNPAAIALYKKLGFSCCGETVDFGEDWYCYEKEL